MEQEKNKNVFITLLVVIIVILLALVILFATGTISLKSNEVTDNSGNQTSENTNTNNNNQIDTTKTNDNNQTDSTDTNKYTVKSMTNAKFNILWDGTEHELKIVDGKLVVGGNTYSIENERIKYFYYNRYQCSHGIVLYYLTENGNVYVTEMSANNNNLNLESLNNFKKLNYSNVTDIVVIPNNNYGKPLDDVSGMTDNVKEYLYALINGETFKLDYQYRC